MSRPRKKKSGVESTVIEQSILDIKIHREVIKSILEIDYDPNFKFKGFRYDKEGKILISKVIDILGKHNTNLYISRFTSTLSLLKVEDLSLPNQDLIALIQKKLMGEVQINNLDANPEDHDFIKLINNSRNVEAQAYTKLLNAEKGQNYVAQKDAHRQYLEALEKRIKLEKEAPGILKEYGITIPVDEALKVIIGLATETKQKLMALAGTLPPILANREAPDIQSILAKELNNALEHLSTMEYFK